MVRNFVAAMYLCIATNLIRIFFFYKSAVHAKLLAKLYTSVREGKR